jgi:hypothetical protein
MQILLYLEQKELVKFKQIIAMKLENGVIQNQYVSNVPLNKRDLNYYFNIESKYKSILKFNSKYFKC